MAKDAKGHGSEAGRGLANGVTNYINHGQAAVAARRGPIPREVLAMRDNETANRVAAAALASGPKSAPVPVHDSMMGSAVHGGPGLAQQAIEDHKVSIRDSRAKFASQFGGPRDHAAEQRGFNSGKREINRLRRQGK